MAEFKPNQQMIDWTRECRSNAPKLHKLRFASVQRRLGEYAARVSHSSLVEKLILACDPVDTEYRLVVVVNREPPRISTEMFSDADHNGVELLNKRIRTSGTSKSKIHAMLAFQSAVEELSDEELAVKTSFPDAIYLGSLQFKPS